MYRLILVLLLLSLLLATAKSQSINEALKYKLEEMIKEEQKWGGFLFEPLSDKTRDSLAKVLDVSPTNIEYFVNIVLNATRQNNIYALRQIFKEYDYPGKSLVGDDASEIAGKILIHAEKLEEFMPLIKSAADKEEIPFTLYAFLLDKHLMQSDKEQVYGTQVAHLKDGVFVVWPISDPHKVNERRSKAGFSQTMEEWLEGSDIVYHPLTLKEFKKLRGE